MSLTKQGQILSVCFRRLEIHYEGSLVPNF